MQNFQGMIFKWIQTLGRFSNLYSCPFKLEKYETKNLYLHYCFSHFPFRLKKQVQLFWQILSIPWVFDLHLAHTYHLAPYLHNKLSCIFLNNLFTKHIVFSPLQVSCWCDSILRGRVVTYTYIRIQDDYYKIYFLLQNLTKNNVYSYKVFGSQ